MIEKKPGFLDADGRVIDGFTIVCESCKSTNVSIEDNVRHGSEWTGIYGSVDILCRNCSKSQSIMDA